MIDNIANSIVYSNCRKAHKLITYRITKGVRTMLSKELVKEVMSTEEYKNRPAHWVNRKTDRGLFISENEKVYSGTY